NFSSKSIVYFMASSHYKKIVAKHFKCGKCLVILKQGDILDEDVDCIVVPVPDDIQEKSANYSLFKTIYNRASKDLQKDLNRKSSKPDFVESCDGVGGNAGFSTEDVTNVLIRSIETHRDKLSEVRIVINDRHVWQDFEQNFCEKSKAKFVWIRDEFEEEQKEKTGPSHDGGKSTQSTENNHKKSDFAFKCFRTTYNQNSQPNTEESQLSPQTSLSSTNDSRSSVSKGRGQPRSIPTAQPPQMPNASKNHSLSSSNTTFLNRRISRTFRINQNKTELVILQGDITKTKCDAIVNAANEHMTGGGGVDGVIHRAAGREFTNACYAHKEIFPHNRLPTGHSRILLSYNMSNNISYIINTAGPVYHGTEKCAISLKSCYRTSLELANLYDLESIGYTAISCGIFGYPTVEGAEIALTTINEFANNIKKVYFVLWEDHIYDTWLTMAQELGFITSDTLPGYQQSSQTHLDDKPSPRTSSTEKFNQLKPVLDLSGPKILADSLNSDQYSVDDLSKCLPSPPVNREEETSFEESGNREIDPVDMNKKNSQQSDQQVTDGGTEHVAKPVIGIVD
ncbi:unnamed protein product, partial [Didymodactylos carnosus]